MTSEPLARPPAPINKGRRFPPELLTSEEVRALQRAHSRTYGSFCAAVPHMVVEDKRGTEESKLSPLARELFALLRHRSEVDRRVVYDALVARLSAAPTSERPARILDALSLCMADIGRAPSRRD